MTAVRGFVATVAFSATLWCCWGLKTSRDGETCAPLKNHGSYSAVEIGIGTPRQSFELVADTGSSNVIVTHCACQQTNCFGYSTPCFTGANRSSTFHIPLGEDGEPESLALEFGSGVIFGVLGSDVVSLGSTSALMNRSLVLMYDHELDAGITDFEGIFGLGLPYEDGVVSTSSWLTTAAVDRFSMCFTAFEEDGVLRLSYADAKASKMKSIGQYHWGLNFNGISVGQQTQEVLFCGGTKTSSRCGIIPDSGTTLMLGPSEQILELFSSLCDRWPRCAKAYAEFNRTQKEIDVPSSTPGPRRQMAMSIIVLWDASRDVEPGPAMAKRFWFLSLLALSLRSLWPGSFVVPQKSPQNHRLRGGSVRREAEEGSSVKLMLNAEERQGLVDLGYSPEEAAEMRMELALVVLERQTPRPWGEKPMPQEWRDEAIRQARLADLEAPQAASSSSSTGGPDFSLVVGGTVVALLVLVAILVVVAGPAPPEGPTPSGYLPPAQGGGYIGSLPEYSLKS